MVTQSTQPVDLKQCIHLHRVRGYSSPVIDTRHIEGADIPLGVFVLKKFNDRKFIRARNQWEYLRSLIEGAKELKPEDLDWWDKMFTRSAWIGPKSGRTGLANKLKPAYPHPDTALECAGCTYGASMVYRLKAMKGPLGVLFKLLLITQLVELIGVLMPYLLSNSGFYPEIFGKGSFREKGHIVGAGGKLMVRHDSTMALTEPEFALGFNAHGMLCMLFLLNDFSESMLEKLCTLYLHKSKTGKGSAFLSSMAVLRNPIPIDAEGDVLPGDMKMEIEIADEHGVTYLTGSYTFGQMTRDWRDIAWHGMEGRDISLGYILSTGTGWAHDDTKPVKPGHVISMKCEAIFPGMWFSTLVGKNKLTLPLPAIIKANRAAKRNSKVPATVFEDAAREAGARAA